jgi:hypothetical protein
MRPKSRTRRSEERPTSAPKRRKLPIWRRNKPERHHDIARLRPRSLSKGQRFETRQDAMDESERSEALLRSFPGYTRNLADELRDCREGDIVCERPQCPRCARPFRRFLINELFSFNP